jgi:transposase
MPIKTALAAVRSPAPQWRAPFFARGKVAREFIAGQTLQGLAKRHEVSPNLIRIWVCKYEEDTFDEAQAADMIQEHEARIAAPDPLAGKQALQLEFLKREKLTAAEKRDLIRLCRPLGISRRKDADGMLMLHHMILWLPPRRHGIASTGSCRRFPDHPRADAPFVARAALFQGAEGRA